MRRFKVQVETVAKYLAYGSHLRKHPCDHKGADKHARERWGDYIDGALDFLAIKEVCARQDAAPNN